MVYLDRKSAVLEIGPELVFMVVIVVFHVKSVSSAASERGLGHAYVLVEFEARKDECKPTPRLGRAWTNGSGLRIQGSTEI